MRSNKIASSGEETMITVFFLVLLGAAGLVFYLFNQRKGADSQHPHQDLPTPVAEKEKRTGGLD